MRADLETISRRASSRHGRRRAGENGRSRRPECRGRLRQHLRRRAERSCVPCGRGGKGSGFFRAGPAAGQSCRAKGSWRRLCEQFRRTRCAKPPITLTLTCLWPGPTCAKPPTRSRPRRRPLREGNFSDLVQGAQKFARSQPTAFFGLALLAGFGAIRFLRARHRSPIGMPGPRQSSIGMLADRRIEAAERVICVLETGG